MSKHSLPAVLRLLHAAQLFESRLAGELSSVHGLSVKELFLLMQLEKAPRHRLARVELAKRLHTSASTVTRMAAPMEKLGLIARETDARDARLAFVVLTKTGAKRVQQAKQTLTRKSTDVFKDRWQEKEIDQLAQLLGRLTTGSAGDLS